MNKKERQKVQEKFLELRSQGTPYEQIASELEVDKETLVEWSRTLRHEIANRTAIRLEAVREKAYATEGKRAELIGERIQAIKTELNKRTLEDLKTKELEELLIKYASILSKESNTVTFKLEDSEFEFDPSQWQG